MLQISLIIFSCLILILYFYLKYLEYSKEKFYIENYTNYIKILDYVCHVSYDNIYKNKILVYSIEAVRLTEKELEDINKEFIKQCLYLLGPKLVTQLTNLFGNRETLYMHISSFFYSQYENDEVRDFSTKNLLDNEI